MEYFSAKPRRDVEKHIATQHIESFQSYVDHFSLTKEDLQKPLLDIGTYDGAFITYVRNVLGNKDAFGVENQWVKLERAQEGLVGADGLSLPFQNETFDVVVAKHYFPMFVGDEEEMRKAVYEALRVLRPGGKVVGDIATPATVAEDRGYWIPKLKVLGPVDADENFFTKRYAGAEKFQLFLKKLNESGYMVEFKDEQTPNGSVIMTIHKLHPQQM